MSPTDLAIVGGGPAGQAAAEAVCGAGLSVTIIDEQAALGGQILRAPPAAFSVDSWLSGGAYRALKAQRDRAGALPGLDFRGRTSVLGLFPTGGGFDLRLSGPDGGGGLAARRVLVAAGCYDLPVALPGWTTPGAMSAGAIQAFTKSQQIVPGQRFVLAGTHPLQLILAQQLVAAGGCVAAVLFAQPASSVLSLLGHAPAVIGHLDKLAEAGRALLALRRAGVPILFGRSVTAVAGEAEVTGVEVTGGDVIACDRVGFCYGFLPQSDLARAADAAFHWAAPHGGWAVDHDPWMRSSVAGLYIAGEVAGVAGAPAALARGAIAGLGVLIDEGRLSQAEAEGRAARVRRRLASLDRFAAVLDRAADPTPYLPGTTPDTVVCRCEDITEAVLAETLAAAPGIGHPNALKLACRAGMGLCQGRYCEHALVRRVAAYTGQAPSAALAFTARFPARPARVGDLIG